MWLKSTLFILSFVLSSAVFALEGSSLVHKSSKWFFDIDDLRPSLKFKIKDKPKKLKMSLSKMKARIQKSKKDERVEPLYIAMRNDDGVLNSLARKYARKGKETSLYNYFQNNIGNSSLLKRGSKYRNLSLNDSAFNLLDIDRFVEKFEAIHHRLELDTTSMKKDKNIRREFLRQIKPYFSKAERKQIAIKIKHGKPIKVDTDLLPEFPKKMVKKFTIYRGPNCFHAAMAFQNKNFTNSVLYNVKKEEGYHRSMINYDELWRILKNEFYEVDLSKYDMEYGDVIAFFDVPTDKPGKVNFRWIKHTATYLFDGYTFSKGSKSSNTPYSVKTLKEEWATWDKYSDLLAVKVFRKSGKSVKKRPSAGLKDWMY